ncbi:uncharacterized protein LOC124911311 isoform X2 [Impatiens glandulifera]|uniref:uncharacterized protein LOC124911311 isoform X2 n=1 Tax=Impatiens glandulifera TaxID=253017 RepID=UPI001FB06FB6|nr:uncharacterized protein LOC124911311 isoform X2 [Impatiens glandulifera]
MEDGEVIRRSLDSNSMESATLGRVMSTLLNARPKKLEEAISRFDSAPKTVSMEESLRILHKYLRDGAQNLESLDQIIVPMLEHSLKVKESKHGNQAMVLLNWLFQDELIFQAIAVNLAGIIERKCDKFIELGWCTLVRCLVEYETTMAKHLNNGIRENYYSLLKLLSPCIARLTYIVCNTSTLQDGFELPTRLSIAATDCILALTLAFTKNELIPNSSSRRPKSLSTTLLVTPADAPCSEKKGKSTSISTQGSDVEMNVELWNHLDELIVLVQKLTAWSSVSRWLHAKGLERVLKWLQDIKQNYACIQDEAGILIDKSEVLLLSSCWKYYGWLLHLENHKFSQHYMDFLDQYLSGIQFYADNFTDEHAENKESGIDTVKFFLNCTTLLLGHCNAKQFENALSDYGSQMSRMLISQFHCLDEDVIEAAACIFRAVLFRSNSSLETTSLTRTSNEMNTVLPLLLNLLDERDGIAKAIVILIAEYCSISTDDQCLNGLLRRLASGTVLQRRNAIGVISEIFRITPDLISTQGDVANHLLDRLGDEESAIRAHAFDLIPKLDPLFVLPVLVHHIYFSHGSTQSSCSSSMLAVLRLHAGKFEVVGTLLDCLSKLCQDQDIEEDSDHFGKGKKLDADLVLSLTPKWSTVQSWNMLIEPLIDKMFAEPSNSVIVRFLSYISEHLAEAADLVFHQLLLHTNQQKEREIDASEINDFMFDHLCPLLIIRILPLSVFDNLNSSVLYGGLHNLSVEQDIGGYLLNDSDSVGAYLLNSAIKKTEYEDVRKLAAELCGRLHPQVLFPVIAIQLEHACRTHDTLKIKACLFSICTSLVVRGKDSIWNPSVMRIIGVIESILSWHSLDGEDVLKAQHGCIDCLALLICAELQSPKSFKDRNANRVNLVNNQTNKGGTTSWNSVLNYVIHQLAPNDITSEFSEELKSPSFRLCMANVLISASQKVSDTGKKPLLHRIFPHLFHFLGVTTEPDIRAACIQVLFSLVFHMKSFIFPYSSDLLKIALKYLKEGSQQERIACTHLLASLMASEESIVENIAGGLLEARTLLVSVTSSDPSPEVRQSCKKLLTCLTSS